ncbi:uncharacterized protein P174DRAFT_271885 [Aspergillus novofumigatus IBT 16806]|uniref:Uncharacterized protein n=1 Tax=Aspergillus novofumigatus (strain IBT 16806) TaxID=1392255 RepID=A0A2I1BZG5_ASPN1|nr:uncharacterized protein P174DRAFT_271885 [Aspergillus novofumigatus IBT 16806]PKX90759.1 hypothetical protein P174DRAFT_271885 [Aspergillus novofumigatus IBT 16806]
MSLRMLNWYILSTGLASSSSIDPLLPRYAKIRHVNLEPDGSSIPEEIKAFRHRWERASDEDKQPSFATFQGQSDQPNCSTQRKCICGDYHPFIDCPYIILSRRLASWKADPKKQRQSLRRLRRREKT